MLSAVKLVLCLKRTLHVPLRSNMAGMLRTDAGSRPLSQQERGLILSARERAATLYRGETVEHHSCGATLAVVFGVSPRPYQSLRRGGITGERFCGSIRGGELLLGELLGDPEPTGSVTPALREAITWYQEQIPERFDRGQSPDYICNNLTAPRGDFHGPERTGFCTDLTAEVAALTLEAILRFAPERAPGITRSQASGDGERHT